MENTKTIGELIQKEVLKQGWKIEDFADAVGYSRGNYYKVIKKNNLDIQLISKASEVLKHNFFQDLANDARLAETNETEEERENRENFSYFYSIVSKILKDMGKDDMFALSMWDKEGDPLPDGGFPFYPVSFTIGETFEQRCGSQIQGMRIDHISDSKNNSVEIITNCFGSRCVNFTIDRKTESEWRSLLKFVFDCIDRYNCKIVFRNPQRY